jgi:hypothetical protein
MNYMCCVNTIDESDADTSNMRYLTTMDKIACVGAGIGGGFKATTELHVVRYDAAMESPEATQWKKAVADEQDRTVYDNVWIIVVPKSEVPQQAKVLTSNGTFRARLNCQEQGPGIHYDPKSGDFNDHPHCFVIMIMAGWTGHVLDVRGAFL